MSERGRRISGASRQSLFFLLLFQLWQKLLAEGFVRPGMIFSKKNPGHTSSLLPFGRQKEKTMSSTSPTSAAASSRCVRDALFLPNEALCRLSLLAVAGSGTSTSGSSGKDSRGGPKHSEAALVVRIGELAKRLDAALSLMRVWWNASLENDVRREVERGRNWSGKEWRRREEGRRAGESEGRRLRARKGGSQRSGGEEQARARERTRERMLGEGARLGVPLARNLCPG